MRALFMVDRRHKEEETEHNGRDERYEYILIEGGFTSFFLDLLEQIRMAIKFIIKLT